MNFYGRTDVGKLRDVNEDSFLATPHFFAVADGMGGHSAGEVASAAALQEAERFLEETSLSPRKAIQKVFSLANKLVFEKAREQKESLTMGTTLTLGIIKGSTLWLVHMGDSRAYLFREGNLRQLTEDHSLVAHLVKEGQLTPEEALDHPRRHIITKAIGSTKQAKPDIFPLKLKAGDRVLFCTDGLTSMLDDGEIAKILATGTPEVASEELISQANKKGGRDNTTAVVVDFPTVKKTLNLFLMGIIFLGFLILILGYLRNVY